MTKLQRILTAIGAGMLLFFTLGAWSLSSPVGSSPDDDFHLASIWCGQGERPGLCELGSKENSRLVPDKAQTASCYAFQPTITAACQGSEYLDEGFSLAETARVNAGSGQYPAGYYLISSFFASNNIAVATVTIRLFNSALFAALLVLTWMMLPRILRFTLAGSSLLTFLPLGLFIIASVNPSSWAFMSGALLIPALLGWYSASGWRRWALGGISAIAAALGFAARGDSAAYVIVGALAAMVLAFHRTQEYWLRSLLPLAMLCIGAVLFISSGQTGLALEGEMGGDPEAPNPTSKFALLAINLVSLPILWNGIFGQGWGLGWLDTVMPPIVPAVTILFFCGVLFSSLHNLNWRRALALAGVGAAVIVIPTYVLVQSGVVAGQSIQPRYVLPLITMFLAVAIAPNFRGRTAWASNWEPGYLPSKLQIALIALGFAGVQSIALFTNLRRNVTTGSYNIDGAIDWWWNAGPSPFGVFTIGSLSWAALMLVFALAFHRSAAAKPHIEASGVEPESSAADQATQRSQRSA